MALTVNPSLPVAAVSAVSQGGAATDLTPMIQINELIRDGLK